ncbi:F0F1 ATP synthase subunit delta [Buchnera aphidicola]|uniref:F0F1 ATP synthase subunit delta n=1 Tax=Buchnera aphidicola TaxID=9 RepID=UPI00346411E4
MLKNITIARPYAEAIFEFAIEKNSLENWKKSLYLFSEISIQKEIKIFFSEIYPPNILLEIFSIIYHDKMDIYEKNLINLLIINKRFFYLKDIFLHFLKLYDKYRKILHVKLISACNFNNKKKYQIHQMLEKKFNKNIYLKFQVNPMILDGIIIYVNDLIINDCLNYHLKELSNFLLY